MSAEMTPLASERQASRPLRQYLFAFVCWWLLAMFATAVRVEFKPWRYIVELFWWQALLLEKTFGLQSAVLARGVWLLVYLGLAFASCWILERGRSQEHAWRRAWVSSALIQLVLLLLAMAISPE